MYRIHVNWGTRKSPRQINLSLSKTTVKTSGYRPVIHHTGSHFVLLNSPSQTQSSTGAFVCQRERKTCRPPLSVTEYMQPNRQKLLDNHWCRCARCTDLLKSKCLRNCSWLCTAGERVEKSVVKIDENNFLDLIWKQVFSCSYTLDLTDITYCTVFFLLIWNESLWIKCYKLVWFCNEKCKTQ